MHKNVLIGGLASLALCGAVFGEVLDEELDFILTTSNPDEVVSTLVYLEQVDITQMSNTFESQRAKLATRHETVVRSLQLKAETTQGALVQHLDTLLTDGRIASYEAFWIGNIIRVDATPDEIRTLAAHPDIDRVFYNFEIEGIKPVNPKGEPGSPVEGGPEPGVAAVRAPEVWAMGIDGTGVLVSTLDTGVDGNHPALASRWRGLDPAYAGNPGWAFFDPVTNWQFPQDSGSHGTHTMGSVLGGAPGNQVGVAPGAEWIHAAVIDRVSIPQTVSDAILSFQWLIDPDGDPGTNFDVPDVCSNSWGVTTGHGYPNCDETFWVFVDACEAAGIVQLFSAGNEGFSGLRRPADRATTDHNSTAVASVNANNQNWPISGFSSRGPTQCTPDGSSAIKPDIAAPGEGVISSVPGNGYSSFSGTSMASPHVNGVVALMRQANPDISVEQIKDIIFETAFDLGSPGEDNDYGHGMIDAVECVNAALATANLTFTFPNGRPIYIEPSGGTTIRVEVSGQQTQPQTGTGKLYYTSNGVGYTEVDMVEVEPNVYDAIFPAVPCGSDVTYYFSAESTKGDFVLNPFSAPDSVYSGEGWSGIDTMFTDDFEIDNGWTVTDEPGLTSGSWERGVPVGGGVRGDPAIDADGSGQCFVTENAAGDTDIDGGATTLESPDMDASHADAVLAYSRWYNNSFGADPANDIMTVEISDDSGATWSTLEIVGPGGGEVNGGWIRKEWLVSDILTVDNTANMRLRFTASDYGAGSVVEAGVDAIEIFRFFCDDAGIPGDIDMDGDVDINDLLDLLAAWGPCPGCPADIDGDGDVDVNDLLMQLANWTG